MKKNNLLFILFLVLVLAFNFFKLKTTSVELDKINVLVEGEVLRPGSFEVAPGITVAEVIELAGGLTNKADVTSINLAEEIRESKVIKIKKISRLSVMLEGSEPIIIEFKKGDIVLDLLNLLELRGIDLSLYDKTELVPTKELEDNMVIKLKLLSKEEIKKKMVVEIRGAIYYPGVYELKTGSRLIDLVELAGGFTSSADLSSLKEGLAKELKDEALIVIPSNFKKDVEKDKRVNLNKASLEEISKIKHMDSKTAKLILDYRLETSLDEEKLINLIGEVKFNDLRENIKFRD